MRRARADGRIDGGVEEITSPMLLKGARVLAVPAVADPDGDANGGTPPPVADAAHAVAFPADGEDGDKKLPAVGHLMMLELLPAAPRALAFEHFSDAMRRRAALAAAEASAASFAAAAAAAVGAAPAAPPPPARPPAPSRASTCPAAARRRRSRRWSP